MHPSPNQQGQRRDHKSVILLESRFTNAFRNLCGLWGGWMASILSRRAFLFLFSVLVCVGLLRSSASEVNLSFGGEESLGEPYHRAAWWSPLLNPENPSSWGKYIIFSIRSPSLFPAWEGCGGQDSKTRIYPCWRVVRRKNRQWWPWWRAVAIS